MIKIDKKKVVAGGAILISSVVLYGINRCFAVLVQIRDILSSRSYESELMKCYDPILTICCIFLFVCGIVVLSIGLASKSA